MAGHASKDAVFKIDDSGGTERNITNMLDKVDLNRTAAVLDTSVYGEDNTTSIAGQKGGTIAIGGRWEAAIDGYMEGDLGEDEVDFAFSPAGEGAGTITYTGKVTFSGYNITTSRGNKVMFSAAMTLTGPVTRAVN